MPQRVFFLFAFLFLAFLQGVFVFFYLGKETAPAFWDYAMYADMASDWFASLSTDTFWPLFKNSFAQNYNLLFAVPSLLSFSLFGSSRTVFILTNLVFYGLAFQFTAAFVLRRIYALSFEKALCLAVCLLALIPFLWYPLLEGYPDYAALACLTAAFVLARANKRDWLSFLALGASLGFAIIFRRHYAYPALALIGTSVFFDLFFSKFRLAAFFRFYFLLAVAALGVLVLIEQPYFKAMLETDFRSLYRSYDRGTAYFLLFLLDRMGFLLLGVSFAGYVFAWQQRPEIRPSLLFVGAFFSLWLFVWAFGPAQAGDHYLIAVPPLFCLVGLASAFLFLPSRAIRFVLFLLLTINAAYALWFAPRSPLPSDAPSPSFLGSARTPWVRDDEKALNALAVHLEKTTSDKDKIVVVSSSFILNQDLMRVLYLKKGRTDFAARRFLFVPEIDGAQPPPFDALAGATVYVVPDPRQFHLGEAGQKGLAAFSAFFPPSSKWSGLFQKDEQVFSLDRDVKVSVWRRAPWSAKELHEALSFLRIRQDAPFDWVLEKQAAGAFVSITAQGVSSAFRFDPQNEAASLFYNQPLSSGRYRLGLLFEAQSPCSSPLLSLFVRDSSNHLVLQQTSKPFQIPGPFFAVFSVPENQAAPFFLSLNVAVRPLEPCSVALSQLRIEKILSEGLSPAGQAR